MHKQNPEPYTPTEKYRTVTLAGWRVRVSPEAEKQRAGTEEALHLLEEKLREFDRLVPSRQARTLRAGVTFWMEWERTNGAAEYHWSPDWLRENGLNPEKARCVEISNVRHFMDWTRRVQPMMVLHELSHALHQQVLGDDFTPLREAFESAKRSGIYDSVPYVLGGKKKAYGLQNESEYLAELSEAYFGRNDFFPYTKRELQAHDERGFRMVQEAWGR